MMLASAGAVLSMMLVVGSAGADERYLVATKARGADAALRVAADGPRRIDPRGVVEFAAVDGFAATLTDDEVAALRASGEVRWIEPVIARHAAAVTTDALPQTIPWGLGVINANAVRQARRSGVVNVVVIDTGLDLTHEDLRSAYAGGINIIDPELDPFDDSSHGTHVAGTIAAADNGVGIVGVAPHARLWVAKVLDGSGSGTSESLIKALDWTLERKRESGGRWIVNLSLGSPVSSPLEREAVARLIDEGVIVVAASGNSPNFPAPVAYPGAYPGVIAVGAVDSSSVIADFSNRGPEIDFAAPGVSVISTLPAGFALASALNWENSVRPSRVLEFSGSGDVTAPLVYCGLGKPGEFPTHVAGKIALIRRGELTFAEKAANAAAAGAAATIIFNNVDEPDSVLSWTLGSRKTPAPIVAGISKAIGEAMLNRGGSATLSIRSSLYGTSSGTSMASPHLAGTIALLWSLAPDATPEQIYNALVTTARDIGASGFDPLAGHGVPDVDEAARQLAPGAFDGRPQTGRRIGSRARR